MAKRKRITVEELLNDPGNFKVLLLAAMGLSDRYISESTGMTRGMIANRVRIAGIRRVFYRDGKSTIARRVIETTERYAGQAIQGQLMDSQAKAPAAKTTLKGSSPHVHNASRTTL